MRTFDIVRFPNRVVSTEASLRLALATLLRVVVEGYGFKSLDIEEEDRLQLPERAEAKGRARQGRQSEALIGLIISGGRR